MPKNNSDHDEKLRSALDHFFQKHIKETDNFSAIIAVSGGPDSMSLMAALFNYAPQIHWHVVTIDHGLREESKSETKQVQDFVLHHNQRNNTNYQVIIFEWQDKKPDTALLEAARIYRYDTFNTYAIERGISHVFLAHHMNDQAETILMRLSKGSGLDGLVGMKDIQSFKQIWLCRPFLSLGKKDLIDYCYKHNICYTTDPTNENPHFLRPRLRHSADILAKEGLTPQRLSKLAKRMDRARLTLDELATQAYDKSCNHHNDKIILDYQPFNNQPEEIAFRIFIKATKQLSPVGGHGIRMEKLEDLFDDIYNNPEFKPRTLGGLIFALKDKNTALYIEKEP